MSRRLAICLEPLVPPGPPRDLPCRELGAGTSLRGAPVWRDPATLAFEVQLDDDEQVARLRRPAGADPLVLHRAGRSHAIEPGASVQLVDQDELSYGGRRLRIHLHEAGAPAGPDELPPPIEVRESPPEPAMEDLPHGKLIVTVSSTEGTQQLELGPEITLGSAEGNHLILPGAGVERRHGRIVRAPSGEVCIVDFHTEGGTLVNGARIQGPTEVGDEDVITIGEFELRVRYQP